MKVAHESKLDYHNFWIRNNVEPRSLSPQNSRVCHVAITDCKGEVVPVLN
jgi:hypothetical protein